MGKNITVAINMMKSVVSLEELSHTVRLCDGFIEDGKIKGNMLTPTVAMMLNMDSELKIKAIPLNRDRAIHIKGLKIPSIGAKISIGYVL